jgi:hypothetical protein
MNLRDGDMQAGTLFETYFAESVKSIQDNENFYRQQIWVRVESAGIFGTRKVDFQLATLGHEVVNFTLASTKITEVNLSGLIDKPRAPATGRELFGTGGSFMKRVLLLSIALVFAFACEKGDDRVTATKDVQIIISDPTSGPLQVTADPDPAKIDRGEAVKWQIVYKAGPPLDGVVIDGFQTSSGVTDPFGNGSTFTFGYMGSSSSGPSESSGAPVKGGDFKYNVTVTVSGSAPVKFDPRLIVNY